MRTEIFSIIPLNTVLASMPVPVLEPASPDAKAIYHLFMVVLLICMAILAVVVALIVTSLVRFRAGDGQTPRQDFGSHRSEIVWAMPPVLIIFTLSAGPAPSPTPRQTSPTLPGAASSPPASSPTPRRNWAAGYKTRSRSSPVARCRASIWTTSR